MVGGWDSLSRRNEPPAQTYGTGDARDDNGVVHVCCGDGSDGWEEEHDADEDDPDDCDGVDGFAPCAHGVGSFDEGHAVLVDAVRDYHCDVAQI